MTPQRVALLGALCDSPTHPTADQLYRVVRRELPTVSPATIYRNLHEMVRAGLINMLEHASGPARYDAVLDDHHHFICTRCGGVTDVYLAKVSYALDAARSRMQPGHVESAEVQLRGICSSCAGASA